MSLVKKANVNSKNKQDPNPSRYRCGRATGSHVTGSGPDRKKP
jgi:hypothetical protein